MTSVNHELGPFIVSELHATGLPHEAATSPGEPSSKVLYKTLLDGWRPSSA